MLRASMVIGTALTVVSLTPVVAEEVLKGGRREVAVSLRGAEVKRDGSRKPAWKWTLDERLAARFDPEAMAAREAEQKAAETRFRERHSDPLAEDEAKMTGPPAATESIDGSKTPELFLPVELFGSLLNREFPPVEERERLEESRRPIERRAAALGFGRESWDRLERIAAPYLNLLRAEDRRRLATGAKDYKRKEDALRICRARAKALESAKAAFGEEAFLRLLYEAVAPEERRTYIFESWPPDYQRHAEELRFLEEGGCR